jgi:hypothetical protein
MTPLERLHTRDPDHARCARAWLAAACLAALTSCAIAPRPREPVRLTPDEARALIGRLLPAGIADRGGWATDVYAAFATMEIAPSPENVCAVIAITEQESSFRTDPQVPGLAAIAWQEIDKQADRAGIPKLVVRTALRLSSPNGKSYAERIDTAKTEKQLSDIFEDFIDIVPLGKTLLADRNPVRTGGPMQVSITFAEAHAASKQYPYPTTGTMRHEVFTRRGGMYFGVAHLLDYPAAYDKHLYRFADFNAGRHASRNAAFQNAVSIVSGIPLALDGDLLRYGEGASRAPGATELAAVVLATRLDLSGAAIRRDLESGKTDKFERTRLYERVFALADKQSGSAVPRAVVPHITLQSPKITRKLTTQWFAERVEERQGRCLTRHAQQGG